MIRNISLILKLLVAGALIAWLSVNPGEVMIDWRGYVIETSAAVLVVFVVLIMVFYATLTRVWFYIKRGALHPFRTSKERALEKGIDSLTHTLLFLARGDAKSAQSSLKKVRQYLPENPLPHLIAAQVAHMSQNPKQLKKEYQSMKANEETYDLGLRGQLSLAMREDNKAEVAYLLEEGRERGLKAPWLWQALFEEQAKEGHWEEALDILRQAEKNRAFDKHAASRHRGVVYLKMAETQTGKMALKNIDRALKEDATFAPIAEAGVDLHLKAGNKRRAKSILLKSWQAQPHPRLLCAVEGILSSAKPPARMKFYRQLSLLKPGHYLGHFAAAEEAKRQKLWGVAADYYDKALEIKPLQKILDSARTLPANALKISSYKIVADPVWVCTMTGYQTPRWQAVTPQGHFNTLRWVEDIRETPVPLDQKLDLLPAA